MLLEITGYFKEVLVGEVTFKSEQITEADFREIIKAHPNEFDNSDNVFAQTTAYFVNEILKSSNSCETSME